MARLELLRSLLAVKGFLDGCGLSELPIIRGCAAYVKRRWFGEFFDDSVKRISASLGGHRFLLPKQFVSHYIFHEYEPLTRRVFLESLGPGMVVIDVGAHIGFYTVIAAKAVGESGIIHAVEPCSQTLEFLKANVTLNQLMNVHVHPFAAGRESGPRLFNITGSSDSHGFYSHPNTKTVRTIEVEQVRLDNLIQGRVDAIKIDVEGAEIEVLDGMKDILFANRDISLLAEWFPAGMRSAGYDPLQLPECLRSLGYRQIRVIDELGGKLRPLEDVISLIQSGSLPEFWYANLWAQKRTPSSK